MKKLILAVTCLMACSSAVAEQFTEEQFSQNPVLRPLTLPDSMLVVGGALRYVEKRDGSDTSKVNPWVRYGVTDNFTIGFDGLTYRFYNDNGLELAVNAGFRGASTDEKDKSTDDDDEWEIAGGMALFGKKVVNEQLAFTFGVDYVRWDSDHNRVNRSEWGYSAGVLYQIAPQWTLNAGYTLRDASSGYDQDDANIYRVGLTKSFGNDFDIGVFYRHSDFDQPGSGANTELDNKTSAGISAAWRF